jgi:subtilisin family serine protease
MKIKLITIACGILLSNITMAQTLQSWMSPEVGDAWRQNYKGSGVTITVVDDFRSRSRFTGNLGYGVANMRHGEWTYNEALMIAPAATMRADDFNTAGAVALNRGLNVLNLSYGMYIAPNVAFRWGSQEQSIVNYATNGNAVISKAAGNDAVAINSVNRNGQIDALNYSLKGTKSAIFVGALSKNGTTTSQASMASYSNTAGTDTTVQKQFLVVGVEGNKTGLYGTSFAAPIVSGYAAIIGSKFTSANATQITNQLLNTARQDTIASYNASIHGRGEASLTRALAPVAIK